MLPGGMGFQKLSLYHLHSFSVSDQLEPGHSNDLAFIIQMSTMFQGSGSQSVLLRSLGTTATPSGKLQVRTIFILTLRNYVSFSLPSSFKCTMEFSNGYMKCNITAAGMQKQT